MYVLGEDDGKCASHVKKLFTEKGNGRTLMRWCMGFSRVEMDPLMLLIHLVLRDGSKNGLQFLTFHVDYVE